MRKFPLVAATGAALLVADAAAIAPPPDLHVVAEGNVPAAGQPSGATYVSFLPPVMSETGEVLFTADLFGGGLPNFTTGLFRQTPAGVGVVAREGTPAPGAGVNWSNLLDFAYIARGPDRVLFPGAVELADAAHDGAIWAGAPGALEMVVREGDPAPGLAGISFTADDFFSPSRVQPSMSAGGIVAFRAFLTGTGVTLSNDEALFAGQAAGLSLVFREGGPAPGANGATFSDLSGGTLPNQIAFLQPSVNSGGRILFRGLLEGTGVTNRNFSGLWFGRPGAVLLAARGDDSAPGLTGRTFGLFVERPVLNDADQILFVNDTHDAGIATVQGVWLGTQGSFAKISAQGETAPNDTATFGATFGKLRLNGAGQAVFAAGVTGSGTGIYGYDAANGLRSFARSGRQAPDMPEGEMFRTTFEGLHFSANGKLFFRSSTTSGLIGLWLADFATGETHIVARTGLPSLVDGVARTFTELRIHDTEGGPEDGGSSAISDDGDVAFLATFTDGTTAIVRTGSLGSGPSHETIPACRAALAAALPNPLLSPDTKSRKVAQSLFSSFTKIGNTIDAASALTGKKQAKKYLAAKKLLVNLGKAATKADAKDRLQVPLSTLVGVATKLTSLIP